jgi:NADH-quinone oxidoreductase subunit A
MQLITLPIVLFIACVVGLVLVLLLVANLFNPIRPGRVKRMPYESGMDPIHDTRRRFDVRFYLLAIAFLVFDVELLFLYPWAVAVKPAQIQAYQSNQAAKQSGEARQQIPSIEAAVNAKMVQNRDLIYAGVMIFIVLLALGFVYDWRKGVFQWR